MSAPAPVPTRPPVQEQENEQVAGRAGTLARSFKYAFAGLFYAFRTQRNLRIHVSVATLGALLGLLLGLSTTEWAVYAVTVMVVMAAEMTNTMIESLVDLVTSEYHPLAKVAKDVAAGIVLLTAIGSVVVGLFLFLPKLLIAFHLLP